MQVCTKRQRLRQRERDTSSAEDPVVGSAGAQAEREENEGTETMGYRDNGGRKGGGRESGSREDGGQRGWGTERMGADHQCISKAAAPRE